MANKLVKAVKAEVYSRVVGYYRPIQDWNRGKQEEYGDRHQMSAEQMNNALQEGKEVVFPVCSDGICRVG